MCASRKNELNVVSHSLFVGERHFVSYRSLVGVLSRIADMIGWQFDGALVECCQEGLCKGDFGHDVLLKLREQRFLLCGSQSERCR